MSLIKKIKKSRCSANVKGQGIGVWTDVSTDHPVSYIVTLDFIVSQNDDAGRELFIFQDSFGSNDRGSVTEGGCQYDGDGGSGERSRGVVVWVHSWKREPLSSFFIL